MVSYGADGAAGGSGGGGGSNDSGTQSGGAASPAGQGNAGAAGYHGSSRGSGSGGGAGGAGATGESNTGGIGGVGLANAYRTGSDVFYAGGGGGSGNSSQSAGGNGGGGAGARPSTGYGIIGTVNTGGGAGGGANNAGGTGGSGIVVIRFVDGDFSASNDMTLVSNTLTSVDAVTKGDMVMTYTNGAGTASLNTDLKGWISRDNGANYTELTLASQGTTGGHTIVTAHDVTLGGTDTSQMRWKVTTHNQSTVKETRIQAVSLGWA